MTSLLGAILRGLRARALLSAGLLVRVLPPDVATELAAAVRTASGDDS